MFQNLSFVDNFFLTPSGHTDGHELWTCQSNFRKVYISQQFHLSCINVAVGSSDYTYSTMLNYRMTNKERKAMWKEAAATFPSTCLKQHFRNNVSWNADFVEFINNSFLNTAKNVQMSTSWRRIQTYSRKIKTSQSATLKVHLIPTSDVKFIFMYK